MYSTSEETKIRVATYEEVKDLPNHPEKLLIDVREPSELIEFGKIPTSVNIPLGELEQALQLSKDDFKNKYSIDKPELDHYIIFHCRSGRRSQQAAEIAVKLGFTNVSNYVGSWLDWAEQEGLPK